MTVEVGKTYHVSYYFYITNHKFFKVTEVSKTGKTFKCVELKAEKDYSDYPYNTYGNMRATDIMCSPTVYVGRYSKKGTPFINVNGDKKCLYNYNGEWLDFDMND